MAAQSLYVCRPLLNGAELHEWAASQGFKSALPTGDMHVTIAFSRDPVERKGLDKRDGKLRITGGARTIEKLGDAVVLRFASKTLAARWQELKDAGASWDWPGYKPHVTISYKGAPSGLKKIEPYDGALLFGPERFAEVEDDAADQDRDETELKGKSMAELDTAKRASLPKKSFGLPGERKYPMPNKSHAVNAKGRATQMLNRGLISEKQHAQIVGKADKVLGES